jgi:uncharacterized membrane protein
VSNFRALARQGIQGRWGDAFVKWLLYSLIVSVPAAVVLMLSGFNLTALSEIYSNMLLGYATPMEVSDAYANMDTTPITLMGLYGLLITGAMTLGITQVYLRYRRKQVAPSALVFSGFSNFSRALALYLLTALFTFLWSLLFIIPGIIAAYRYRLAFYILAENPNVGPLEAINISKGLMRGNKWKLFCLDLSFLGWILLAVFAGALVMMPFTAIFLYSASPGIIENQVISMLIGTLLGWLYMYMGTASAAFYERASGLLKYHDEVPANTPPAQYR